MNSRYTSLAVGLVLFTVLAWTGVIFFVRGIGDAKAARVAEIQNSQQSSTQQGALVRMHAIAEQTAQDRARLDQILSIDVGSAATMLRNVGKTTHVTVELSNALPELPPKKTPSGPQIQAVGFAVQADGTFKALMRTAQLLETLPLASEVERFEIERAQDTAGTNSDVWHMSIYIRVLTTSSISS